MKIGKQEKNHPPFHTCAHKKKCIMQNIILLRTMFLSTLSNLPPMHSFYHPLSFHSFYLSCFLSFFDLEDAHAKGFVIADRHV